MGSKGIKAIVIENDGNHKLEIKNRERYRAALKDYINEIRNAPPQTSVGYPLYGTAGIIPTISVMGALPSYAFRKGSFEKADEISGERLRELILERGRRGNPPYTCLHARMFGEIFQHISG